MYSSPDVITVLIRQQSSVVVSTLLCCRYDIIFGLLIDKSGFGAAIVPVSKALLFGNKNKKGIFALYFAHLFLPLYYALRYFRSEMLK